MKIPKPLPTQLGDFFTARDAVEHGVSVGRLRNKDVGHPFRGVFSRTGAPFNIVQICRALQQGLPDTSRFYGVTAAQLFGVPLPRSVTGRIHVSVEASTCAPTGHNIIGHRVGALPFDETTYLDLRLSSPEHTWYELSATLGVLDLVAAGDYLIRNGQSLTTRADLAGVEAHYVGHRGIRTARDALKLLDERAESPQESKLRVILQRGGIAATPNMPIITSGGFRYRADLCIAASGVVIEYQSDQFHRDAAAYRNDMTRVSRLEADGLKVMFINANDLRDPAELCARVNRVTAGRAAYRSESIADLTA